MDLFYYLLSTFGSMAPWTRWLYVIVMIMFMVGLGAFFTPTVGIIVAIGLVVVALVVGAFKFILYRRQQKPAAAFGGELRQATATTPGQISDPAQLQRLEDLRQSFEKGLERFRTAGKDLYSLPWYVIVGEPGAGK